MRAVLIFSFMLALASAEPGFFDTVSDIASGIADFGSLLIKTGKKLASAAGMSFRKGIIAAKMVIVNSINAAYELKKCTFKVALNLFSDMSTDEFISKMTGYERCSEGDEMAKEYMEQAPVPTNEQLPESFDWREQGGVTNVKYQGDNCNSCWSFAVTGALEGHVFRKTNLLMNLSEQNLIDCSLDFGNKDCRGGFQDYGFTYIIDNNGIAMSEKYPYTMKKGKCQYKSEYKGAGAKAFAVIEKGNEQQMKEVIATLGPIACSINVKVESFILYKEGIYSDEECNKAEVNHSVLVVGYGSEDDLDYWIVKNSWGDKWGEDGYIRILRNMDSFCGIASECSYPIV